MKEEAPKTPYVPSADCIKYAPAFICNIASRINRLRSIIKKKDQEGQNIKELLKELEYELCYPLPFEKELLSGNILKVEEALCSEKKLLE